MRSVCAVALLFITHVALAIELPVVPASVVEGIQTTDSKPAAKPGRRDDISPVQDQILDSEQSGLATSTADINVVPGVNEIVPIAIGHLNRIVTPFESPEIHTTSQAATRVDGSVVYIGTKTAAAVGLYITDKAADGEAISLTLVPKKIPPRELRVRISSKSGRGDSRAKRWEESQPYIEIFRNVFRTIALGQIPSGYEFKNEPARWVPPCATPAASGQINFDFKTGQTLVGRHLEIAVGVVTNHSEHPLELDELWCAGDGTTAVAFWPRNLLEPGQASEVYVAKRTTEQSPRPYRSSLVPPAESRR